MDKIKPVVDPVEVYINKNKRTVVHEKFFWLMEKLIPPNPAKFKGCELIFPDTAFFENGLCKSIMKNDEDYCLI